MTHKMQHFKGSFCKMLIGVAKMPVTTRDDLPAKTAPVSWEWAVVSDWNFNE